MSGRRLVGLLVAALAVAAPAVALRLLCVGRACPRPDGGTTPVPFCSLPRETRDLIGAGFRDGRGPHVLAIAGVIPVRGADGLGGVAARWPSAEGMGADRVPLAFAGRGVAARAEVPGGITLDRVAPTVAELIGLDRPHPGVRSGEAIAEVAAGGDRPRLILEVVWKGVGSADLEDRPAAWPTLQRILDRGAGTLDAQVGSLPLDPAAALATIGTGGLPKDHGITGALVRNDAGRVVEAWSPPAPFSVIATLADDLDELTDQAPRIGLVGTETWDRGLVGGNWYIENDRDDVSIDGRIERQIAAARRLLASGYGDDEVPDLLAMAMEGPIARLDRALGRLVELAGRTSPGTVAVVVTATGSTGPGENESIPAADLEQELETRLGDVVEATAVGGFFLDQEAMTAAGLTDDDVARAARVLRIKAGGSLLADVFPQIAVSFARYC